MFFSSKLQTFFTAINLLGLVHLLFLWPFAGTTRIGFTTHLIHRDSPLSPFYNQSKTRFDYLYDAFQRSFDRVNHFKSALAPRIGKINTTLHPGGGEYLMKMFLGTPPIEIVAILDTGSDLIWTQCEPCIECYKQISPIFDPRLSSTFKFLPCQIDYCQALDKSFCNKTLCSYRYSYGDGSTTKGSLGTETVTIGSNKSISFPKIAIGCSNISTGLYDESGSGIIGLGRGKLSIVSQLGESIGKYFAYCLAPSFENATTLISFGTDYANSSNGGVIVTTPIITKSSDNFYYLSMEGFTIGNQTITYNYGTTTSDHDGEFEGNIVIDSGTTFTFLPVNVVEDMVSAVDKLIDGEKVNDPNGIFELCYKYKDDGYNIQLPNITAHFKGAQGNFKIGFDIDASTLSFQPTNCMDLYE
ncbi:unnamed protein product [Lupinus luteus]|uniref:Peptidase A1 domain-containing protein n=1 Tax=Lupinus luteus TaxID=3873 RepID=A0AAV1WUG4_LUPLU